MIIYHIMFVCSFSQNSVITARAAVVFLCLVAAFSTTSPTWGAANAYRFRALILRHGQTCSNAGGIIQGSSDLSRLTDLGNKQARDVALAISKEKKTRNDDFSMKFVQVYCSPLTRARQTYQVLHENNAIPSNVKHPIILSDLREIDFYDWQDQTKDTLKKEYPNSYKAWKAGDPYGLVVPETTTQKKNIIKHRPLLELWERADQVWEEILFNHINVNKEGKVEIVDEQSILIVAHGSLGQALLGTAMGWDATHFRQYEFPNCGLVEIEWREDQNSGTMEEKSTSSSSSFSTKISSSSSHHHHRPKAIRWRWKWPESSDWNSYSDSILLREEEISPTF